MIGHPYRVGVKQSPLSDSVRFGRKWKYVEAMTTVELVEVLLYRLGEMEAPLAIRTDRLRREMHVLVDGDEQLELPRITSASSRLLAVARAAGPLLAQQVVQDASPNPVELSDDPGAGRHGGARTPEGAEVRLAGRGSGRGKVDRAAPQPTSAAGPKKTAASRGKRNRKTKDQPGLFPDDAHVASQLCDTA
ncbi:MAG: hypothetical protein MUF80_02285 [Burkholderiales bacterium]|nr:hypothetical protein [Burkholderiales bacterium]